MNDRLRCDPLDEAIDRVATQLVSVEADASVGQRIVSSLPERRQRGWVGLSWPLQAAGLATVALAIAYMRSTSIVDHSPRIDSQPPASVAAAVAPESPTVPTRPRPAARLATRSFRPSTRPAAEVQHTFELPAIEVPAQLSIETLTWNTPLDSVEPASVPPILLSDLPLRTDGPPPIFKE